MFDSDVFEVSKRDFRYIALLAYVNANRTKAFLELVAEDNKYLPLLSKKTFPKPYPGFQDDLEYHLHSILVSHKKENKLITTRINNSKSGDKKHSNFCVSVRGSLHKESVFENGKPRKY